MTKALDSVTEYIDYLISKGFLLGEDASGFIQFGQNYTKAKDHLVIIAIELTLKIQKEFDGAFFISLLEEFQKKNINTKEEALKCVRSLNLL